MKTLFPFLSLSSMIALAAGAEVGSAPPAPGAAPAARNWGDVDPSKGTYRLKPETKTVLLSLKAATEQSPVFVAASGPVYDELVTKHELAFVNVNAKDAAGNVAAILSPAGRAKLDSYSGKGKSSTASVPTETLDPSAFTVEYDVPPPSNTRGTPKPGLPFHILDRAGASFFVPPSAATANPAKSKQTAVTQYNRKAAEDHKAAVAAGTAPADSLPVVLKIRPETRKDAAGADIVGARIWRTQ